MARLVETPVVTCFLRHGGDVLLLRRSSAVGSYRGLWGAVAGYAEGDPDAAARREIEEETGLGDAVDRVRRGEPFPLDAPELGKRWIVHPYLFDCARRDVRTDWESTDAAWVPPPEILRRPTVPELWTSYRRVAPTVESLAADREHGSAWLSLRALEVLRDAAAELGAAPGDGTAREELRRLARRLVAARPAMAAPANRVHRAMHACRAEGRAAAVEAAAGEAIGRALAADERAAEHAARRIAGRRVLTLSRSGTVTRALLAADPPPEVWVAESRPGGEGVEVARRLAGAGLAVTLIPDAAVDAALAAGVEQVLLGADTVLADGSVVNKVGSCAAALAAARHGRTVLAVAAADKVSPDAGAAPSELADAAVLGPEVPGVARWSPLFERVLAGRVGVLVTEEGEMEPAGARRLAEELAALRRW